MPPADTSVRRGRKIKLILSLGGRVLEVPELVGLPMKEAIRKLAALPAETLR